jgi:hypothetical protein
MQEPGGAPTAGSEGFFPLIALVWLQRESFFGLFQPQDPGLLIARAGGAISLVTLSGKVFDAEKHDIGVQWPWYQFGQGVRLKVAGKTYWFAWMPGSATAASWGGERTRGVLQTLAGREGLDTVYLAQAKVWRRYLKT